MGNILNRNSRLFKLFLCLLPLSQPLPWSLLLPLLSCSQNIVPFRIVSFSHHVNSIRMSWHNSRGAWTQPKLLLLPPLPPSPSYRMHIACISHAYRIHSPFAASPLRLSANWNFKWTNSLCRRSLYMGHYVVSSARAYISYFGRFLHDLPSLGEFTFIMLIPMVIYACSENQSGNELIKVQQIVDGGSKREGFEVA